MSQQKFFRLLAAIALWICPSVALAQELNGFRQFDFGLPIHSVLAQTEMTLVERNDERTIYRLDDSALVDGEKYHVELKFGERGLLREILLAREGFLFRLDAENDKLTCHLHWTYATEAIRSTYDLEATMSETSDYTNLTISKATFNFENGAYINSDAHWNREKETCLLFVFYRSGTMRLGY